MDIKDDSEIIRECLSGNTDVYRFLIDKYHIRIINTCNKYTKNLNDAEDLAQEVFFKAYQNLNTFKFDSKFYSWLYRIAVNTSLNYINSKEKRQEKETISDESCLSNVSNVNDDPSDNYRLVELKSKIEPLMNKLPEDLKKILLSFEVNNMTYAEISNELKMPIGTVRSRLHRARNMLISEFAKINDNEK